MNKRLAVLAIGAGLIAIPVIVTAQATTAPSTSPVTAPAAAPAPGMVAMKPPANSATAMCRPATGTEKPNATMNSQAFVCKTMSMSGGMMMVPDAKSMKSPAEADRAWRDWLTQSLVIPPGGTGGG